jgi:hypothetical protein
LLSTNQESTKRISTVRDFGTDTAAAAVAVVVVVVVVVMHTMRQDHRLQLALDDIAIITSKHVDLALIQTQLANVGLEVEDIGALHAWVEDLCRWHLVTGSTTHDLRASFDTCQVEGACDIDHKSPVLLGCLVDLLR